MTKKKDKESEDMFSDLPETIVHEIMCLSPIKDAIRTGTVSKKFTSAWNSIPILNFDLVTSIPKYSLLLLIHSDIKLGLDTSKLVPLDFVRDCLRLRTPDLSLKKFRMRVFFVLHSSSDCRADEAILMAIEKGVRELSLQFQFHFINNTDFDFHYSVPLKVFSADSITLLSLCTFTVNQPNLIIDNPVMEELWLGNGSGFLEIQVLSPKLKKAMFVKCKGLERIEIKSLDLEFFKQAENNDENCMIEILACGSLKVLDLEGSSVTDDWLKENLPKFLVLESLQLKDCRFVTYLHVLNDGIKFVGVKGCDNLRRIVIDAQSLEIFEYETDEMERRQCEIRILHCKNLVLVGASITDSWLKKHMAQLVLLESLTLRKCYLSNKITIYDHETLKSLVLESCSGDLEVECRVRNLAMFTYVGDLIPSPPLVIAGDLHAKFSLKFPSEDTHYEANLATSLLYGPFKKLRDFLAFYSHCKTITLVVDQAFIFPAEVRGEIVPPFYGMSHLKLEFSWDSMPVVELVDSALWLAPHLEILTLAPDKYRDILITLEYGKTGTMCNEEETDPGSCCFRRPVKCWRHKVTKVAIEKSKYVEEDTCKRLIHFFSSSAKTLEEVVVDGHSCIGNRSECKTGQAIVYL